MGEVESRDTGAWCAEGAAAEGDRRAGRIDTAEAWAREALESDPEDAAAAVVLALARLDDCRVEQARAALEHWVESTLPGLQLLPRAPAAAVESERGLPPDVRDLPMDARDLPIDADLPMDLRDLPADGDLPMDAGELPMDMRELPGDTAESSAGPDAVLDSVSDLELDSAFEAAEAEREQMLDADDVALQAMRDADGGLGDELFGAEGAPFATRTVAELLEQQGDQAGASRVRAVVADASGVASAVGARGGVVAELERWLHNLQGDRA